jgi:hypothetical protein
MLTTECVVCCLKLFVKTYKLNYISHKNREISILTIKRKKSKVNFFLEPLKFPGAGKTKLRTKDYKTKTKQGQNKQNKHECSMNNSASLTLVQGPSTVTCMIVTYLSQLDIVHACLHSHSLVCSKGLQCAIICLFHGDC